MGTAKALPLKFERSPRKGLTAWALLLIGVMFVIAAYTVDPLTNCDASGECAPWLIPIAGIMGWGAIATALGLLFTNPRRGYCIEPSTGDLLWWKNRTARHIGDIGRIHPSAIMSVWVDLRDEQDSVSLYGEDSGRLHYCDEDLIPWPCDRWAEQFRQAYPHIRVDKLD